MQTRGHAGPLLQLPAARLRLAARARRPLQRAVLLYSASTGAGGQPRGCAAEARARRARAQEQARMRGGLYALRILARKYEFKDEEERGPLAPIVAGFLPPLLQILQACSRARAPPADLSRPAVFRDGVGVTASPSGRARAVGPFRASSCGARVRVGISGTWVG